MSDNRKRPLTRREIREREQAAAAEAAPGAGPGGPSIAGPSSGQYPPRSSYGAPPIAPADPQPRPGAAPGPSRRALREPEQSYRPQAPVVRPPMTTGGVRGVDETGRLTPVQRTSGDALPPTPASANPPPHRTPTRQPFGGTHEDAGTGARGVPGPGGAPRTFGSAFGSRAAGSGAVGSAPQAPPQAQPSAPPSPWGVSAPTPASVPPSRPDLTSRPDLDSRFGSPRTSDTAASRAASPALPWETSQAEAPARPASASPFDALVGSDQPVRARSSAPQVEPDDDDDDWEEPESSYTWLHYIVLIVVAFVLGLLVWKLLLDGPAGGFETGQAAAVVGAVVTSGYGGLA